MASGLGDFSSVEPPGSGSSICPSGDEDLFPGSSTVLGVLGRQARLQRHPSVPFVATQAWARPPPQSFRNFIVTNGTKGSSTQVETTAGRSDDPTTATGDWQVTPKTVEVTVRRCPWSCSYRGAVGPEREGAGRFRRGDGAPPGGGADGPPPPPPAPAARGAGRILTLAACAA